MNSRGQLLIADTINNRILQLESARGTISAKTGTISDEGYDEGYIFTVVGTGARGFSGDRRHPRIATLNNPFGVAVDRDNNIFISDFANNRVRRVGERTGIITTVAGDGALDQYKDGAFKGDGGPGTSASLDRPKGVAVDGSGNVYIADSNNHRIRRVAAGTGVITTVAGDGYAERGVRINNWGKGRYGGDGGPATSASLNYPSGVALDASGNLFIADRSNHRIRRVAAGTGVITTVAGTGALGFSGDGGPATSALLRSPSGVAVDSSGNLFIADSENNRIRVVNAGTGIIATIAGNGTEGFGGDGGPAIRASLNDPIGLCVDTRGNVFILDTKNDRIRILVDSAPIHDRIFKNVMRLFNEGAVPNGNNQEFNNLLNEYKTLTGHDIAFHTSPRDEEVRALVASIEQLISGTHPDQRDSNYNAAMSARLARYRALTGTEYVPSSSRSLLRSSPQVQLRKNEAELSSNSAVSQDNEPSKLNNSKANNSKANIKNSKLEPLEPNSKDNSQMAVVIPNTELDKVEEDLRYLTSLGLTKDSNNEAMNNALAKYRELTGNEYVPSQEVSGGRKRRNKKSRKVKSRRVKKSRQVKKSRKINR
jgi:sugar lactone lactonase YvrE